MRFRLFGFPVEFSFTMLILFLIVGRGLPIGVAIVAVLATVLSVLIHELAHAAVATAVGGEVDGITLYALGGVTRWRGSVVGWRRIIVAAAGSLTSIALAVAVWGLANIGALGSLAELVISRPWLVYLGDALDAGNSAVFFVGFFVWVSAVWGAFNLLPIGGLDGGTILAEMLEKLLPGSGRLHGAIIGLLVGAAVGFLLYQQFGDPLPAIIIGIFAVRALVSAVGNRAVY